MKRTLLLSAIYSIISFAALSQISAPRPWAEWEETRGVIIMQPNLYPYVSSPADSIKAREMDSTYVQLIRGLLEEGVKVYYLLDTTNSGSYNSAILDTMQSRYGLDINNNDFELIRTNRRNVYTELNKWTRDHGPMNVYTDEADTLYNILFYDDLKGAGKVVANYLDIPTVGITYPPTGMPSSDGGNYQSDGYRAAVINDATDVTLPLYQDLFGLDTVYLLPSYIVHVDYYAKLLNEETLLLGRQLPENYIPGFDYYTYESDSVALDSILQYIQQNVVTRYGTPYRVYRLPNAPSYNDTILDIHYTTTFTTYVNSLIANHSVFVPQYGNGIPDQRALDLYSQVMPGYRIVPVFCRQPATEGGAVHCITNSVAADEPVWIYHHRLPDTVDQTSDYQIDARIISRTGIMNAKLYWALSENGEFSPIEMDDLGDSNFRAFIPGQDYGSTLYYYIEAESNSGKTGRKPFVAPDWTYSFKVERPGGFGIGNLYPRSIFCSVYPNPGNNFIRFDINKGKLSSTSELEINVYDISGRKKYFSLFNEDHFILNVSSYPGGNYIYVIRNEKGNFCSGFISVKH